MKIYKLAHNTVDNKDYDILINFLKKRRYLNQSKVTKTFEKKFSDFLANVFDGEKISKTIIKVKKKNDLLLKLYSIFF